MTQIKPQELRIGNWVNNSEGVPIKVLFIMDAPSVPYYPIPLSEEILLKSGFVETYNSPYSKKFEHKKNTQIEFRMNKEFGDFKFSHFGNYLNCQYTHQLQNLYFCLTGEELTITL